MIGCLDRWMPVRADVLMNGLGNIHMNWPHLHGVEDHEDVLQAHNRRKGQTGEADHPGQPQKGKQHSTGAGRFPVHRQGKSEIHTTTLVTGYEAFALPLDNWDAFKVPPPPPPPPTHTHTHTHTHSHPLIQHFVSVFHVRKHSSRCWKGSTRLAESWLLVETITISECPTSSFAQDFSIKN